MTSGILARQPFMYRASSVSLFARISRVIFGGPSASRASGRASASLLPDVLRSWWWRHRLIKTPVYALDRRGIGTNEQLPRIWLSESFSESNAQKSTGRVYVSAYPVDADRQGNRAFELAERMFAEGLNVASDSADVSISASTRATRIACFQAAEILYLHAVAKGHVEAHVKLGVLYAHDMCEGAYYQQLLARRARHAQSCPLEKRAHHHFQRAAEAGSAEAYWQLGDVLRKSNVTDEPEQGASEQEVYQCYLDAFSCARDSENRGRAAYRLARSFEEGFGCIHSFSHALSWYQRAIKELESCFSEGQWYAKRELIAAKRGAQRMSQELSGKY